MDAAKGDPAALARIAADYESAALGGASMPQLAGVAATAAARLRPGRVQNPRVHDRDVRGVRMGDRQEFARRARRVAQHRELGDPDSGKTLAVASALSWFFGRARRGARATHEAIATAALCCVDTVRRVVRQLERAGILDTLNVLERRELPGVGRRLVRGANLYLIPRHVASSSPHGGEEEAPAASAGLSPLERLAAVLARWAPAMGLFARAGGMNTAPARGPP
jgi:hypothetical protein